MISWTNPKIIWVGLGVVLCGLILSFAFVGLYLSRGVDISIVDAKTAMGVDEKLMPLQVTKDFPKDTSKVVCWFNWKNAKANTEVIARWHYITDDIHILDYPFTIPKKQGSGSVTLTSPEGKALPAGEYKVQLNLANHVLKSLVFTIK